MAGDIVDWAVAAATICGKGWAHRCAASKGRRCQCACGGRNHGTLHGKSLASRQAEQLEEKERKALAKYHAQREGQIAMLDPERVPEYDGLATPVREFKRDAHPADGWVLVCFRLGGDAHFNLVNERERAQAVLEQRLVRHSPAGMNWGYLGSGPADLALNVLALFVDPREANRLHQDFKFDIIGRMDQRGAELPLPLVRSWIQARWDSERGNGAMMAEETTTREMAQRMADEDPGMSRESYAAGDHTHGRPA
jgi:hypothetical protein